MPLSASVCSPVSCEQAVVFEYRNETFYLTDPSLGVTRTMEPETMLASFQGAAEAINLYIASKAGGAAIIQFPTRSAA